MRDLNDCPTMPDYPTINGNPVSWYGKSVNLDHIIRPVDGWATPTKDPTNEALKDALPVLVSIGLLDALKEVEGVLAWNETEKHPNAKWKSKTISYHDAKAVSHLNWSQCGVMNDYETLKSHRAHAACRLLMSLALELKADKKNDNSKAN